MATINFYWVDYESDNLDDDVLVGSVTIEDGKIESDDEDLKTLAGTFGGSAEEVIENLSNWSNGYLRTELAK